MEQSEIDNRPLYSSRIIKTFIKFIKARYSHIDIDDLLHYAKMEPYQVEDGGYWLTQEQGDLFYEKLEKLTGNRNIAREAGRYAASPEGLGVIRQYALGLVGTTQAFGMLEKFASAFTRSTTYKSKKVAPNKVEITVTLNEGVKEKQYQCENRLGYFDAIALAFRHKLPHIEHPECIFRGGKVCRYIIVWREFRSDFWKKLRNYAALALTVTSLGSYLMYPNVALSLIVPASILVVFLLSLFIKDMENKELKAALANLWGAPDELLEQINLQYNNLILINEIGQAIRKQIDIDSVLTNVIQLLEKRLDYDRGAIFLTNEDKTRLVFRAGFGHTDEELRTLIDADFHLDRPESKGIFAISFREQKPFLINDVEEIKKDLSPRSLEFAKQIGAKSFICCPIIYEEESLGILAVDNVKTKRPLVQSDINLLMSIATQIGISIRNAIIHEDLLREKYFSDSVINSLPGILYLYDEKGNLLRWSKNFEEVTGYSVKELLHMKLLDFFSDYEKEVIAQKMHETFSEGRSSVEAHFMTKSGTKIPFHLRGSLLKTDSKAYLLGIGIDISERKYLEAQLLQAQKMEAIGQLAGGVAHDFNNILTAIIGYASLMKMKMKEDDPLGRNVERILFSSERAANLVQSLLAFSRKQIIDLRTIKLNDVVKRVEKLLTIIISEDIELKTVLTNEDVTIVADSGQIEQVLINLATNARDAMPNGGILTIATELVELDEKYTKDYGYGKPGRYVLISVTDTGIGMDEKIKERIFEPFFTTKEVGKGTGLGLAMVYGTVKQHDGYINVFSKSGKGTTFKIYLPVIESKIEEVKPAEITASIGGNETILLVEDEEEVRKIMKSTLSAFGYTVIVAIDGEDAMNKFMENKDTIQFLLLDVIMPRKNGKEVYQEVKKLRPDIKTLFISGYAGDIIQRKGIHEEKLNFVLKPISPEELLKKVREVLDS